MGSISGSGIGSAGRTGAWARLPGLLGVLILLTSAAPPGAVELSFDSARSHRGLFQVCLTRDSAAFPECVGDTLATKRSVSAAQPALRFEGLPTGSYAVAVFHDENGNGRLDTALGIPREGFGFSRNPPMRFGPPRFSAARFDVAAGANSERVRIRYLL